MEARRTEQMLKAIDGDKDGKHRKQEEFPNVISVGAIMDDAAAVASRIDIAGGAPFAFGGKLHECRVL